MTMHLIGPWLSTSGKKKGKQKFRNAEQAQKARELDDSWQKLLANHGAINTKSKKSSKVSSRKLVIPKVPEERSTKHIKSLDTGHVGAVNIRKPMQYTGDKIVGIGTMHKSNAVPIFSDKEAKEISSMRR